MANKGRSYGFSRECQLKTLAKFDVERAQIALQWIEDVIGRDLTPPHGQPIGDHQDVRAVLKDGQALCELINEIKPGSVRKIHKSNLPFKEMENIELFLRGCRSLGMKEVDVFQTQDLYEAKSMYTVINCIHILGSLAQKVGFQGPTIGVKLAEENRRSFTEEQITEGKKVINLQYGSNRGASQSGMTPYGSIRKM